MIVLFSVRFLNTLFDTLSRRRRENVEDSAQFSLTFRAVYLTQTAQYAVTRGYTYKRAQSC